MVCLDAASSHTCHVLTCEAFFGVVLCFSSVGSDCDATVNGKVDL